MPVFESCAHASRLQINQLKLLSVTLGAGEPLLKQTNKHCRACLKLAGEAQCYILVELIVAILKENKVLPRVSPGRGKYSS